MKTNLLLSIITFALSFFNHSYSQNYCNLNPVDIHGNLSVSGNKIVDQNNSPVSFAGNSFFWSNTGWGAERFYNASAVSWLKNDWGTTIVRAAMGVEDNGGYLSDASNKDRVQSIVDAAIAEGLYVIIDWHSHNAENYQDQAISFFEEMATLYGSYPNVIYEIYNEPIYSSWSGAIKPYAESVISAIRAIDGDNLIIVGSSTWSQDVDIASNDPITSSTNIAYTLHFYAGTHFGSLRAKAQTALNNGIALMVTEWGTVNANGDGGVNVDNTNQWMNFLAENDISHLNWSVHDKTEGASILNLGASSNGGWSNANLTASGAFVKSIIDGWDQYCAQEPPANEFVDIPSRIEAEDYASQVGTQVEDANDNGSGENVGYIDTNDSLTYNITVPNSGSYTMDFRLASREAGVNFDIYEGNSLIGSVSSSATGGWQSWETVSMSVNLSSGNQTITLIATEGGWNINWLEFSTGAGGGPVDPPPTTSGCDGIAEWDPNTTYGEEGTQVVFEGNIYENKWYTLNQSPADFSANSWDLWTLLGACTSNKNIAIDRTLGFTVYPNPFNNEINVSIENSIHKVKSLMLVGLSGNVISTKSISGNFNTINDLNDLAKGMYLLQAINAKDQIIFVVKMTKH